MIVISPNIYITLGVMNNLEVIQSLQEGIGRQYANTMPVLLWHTQILVPLGGGVLAPTPIFPMQNSSHPHNPPPVAAMTMGPVWMPYVWCPCPPIPGWKGQRASCHPTLGPLTKIPLCKAQQQLGLMLMVYSVGDVSRSSTLEHSAAFSSASSRALPDRNGASRAKEPTARRKEVKIHPPVQVTGIRGGKRDEREKGVGSLCTNLPNCLFLQQPEALQVCT